MNTTPSSAQDDLAFLRSLVESAGSGQRVFGVIYFWSGVIYGLQCLGHWAQVSGWIALSDGQQLLLGLGPTAVFLVMLTWVLWRTRRAGQGGLVNKAVSAAFAATGIANGALVVLLAAAAAREKSLTVWLLYPSVVFILQGAAWYIAFALRKRLWLLAVGLGWMATGVTMGFAIGTPSYPLLVGVGLLAFMVAPGAVMMRRPASAA
jgi:hypothetical protein